MAQHIPLQVVHQNVFQTFGQKKFQQFYVPYPVPLQCINGFQQITLTMTNPPLLIAKQEPEPQVLNHKQAKLTPQQFHKVLHVLTNLRAIASIQFGNLNLRPNVLIREIWQNISTSLTEQNLGDVSSVNIVGGATSYILKKTRPAFHFNDLDILFELTYDLQHKDAIWKLIQQTVWKILDTKFKELTCDRDDFDFSFRIGKPCYCEKMCVFPKVGVQADVDEDVWGLISLRNPWGHNLELKFFRKRDEDVSYRYALFEYSLNSFQIQLPENLENMHRSDLTASTLSEKGFKEAFHDLNHMKIKIDRPEQLRGAGFLKYAYLVLQRGNSLMNSQEAKTNMIYHFLKSFKDWDKKRLLKSYIRTHCLQNVEMQFYQILKTLIEESNIRSKVRNGDDLGLYEFICNLCEELSKHKMKRQLQRASNARFRQDMWQNRRTPPKRFVRRNFPARNGSSRSFDRDFDCTIQASIERMVAALTVA